VEGPAPEHPDAAALSDAEALEVFRSEGVDQMFGEIKASLHDFGVDFDVYFHENDLHESGAVERAIGRLDELGKMYEQDGARWLRTSDYGDDKDRVVIRSDGRMTYIAADIAYHRRKFLRGFELLVNLWGPDHHGYIARIKAAVQAMGYPADALQIRILQLCTLKRGT